MRASKVFTFESPYRNPSICGRAYNVSVKIWFGPVCRGFTRHFHSIVPSGLMACSLGVVCSMVKLLPDSWALMTGAARMVSLRTRPSVDLARESISSSKLPLFSSDRCNAMPVNRFINMMSGVLKAMSAVFKELLMSSEKLLDSVSLDRRRYAVVRLLSRLDFFFSRRILRRTLLLLSCPSLHAF